MSPANIAVSAKFLECHPVTAGWEGGWANHKDDPGGQTMYGITWARYDEWRDSKGLPRQNVNKITREEALAIFFEGYWKGSPSCENLFPGVDLATYDASVMSGPGRGRKWLLASLDKQNRHDRTVMAICAKRLSFVEGLKHFKTFGRGWSRRIADVQAKGVARALKAMQAPSVVVDQLRDLESLKKSTATKQSTGAVATGGSGTTTVVVSQPPPTTAPAPDLPSVDIGPSAADWILAGLGVLLVGLALWLVWRAFLSHQQAQAFGREAKEISHGA